MVLKGPISHAPVQVYNMKVLMASWCCIDPVINMLRFRFKKLRANYCSKGNIPCLDMPSDSSVLKYHCSLVCSISVADMSFEAIECCKSLSWFCIGSAEKSPLLPSITCLQLQYQAPSHFGIRMCFGAEHERISLIGESLELNFSRICSMVCGR